MEGMPRIDVPVLSSSTDCLGLARKLEHAAADARYDSAAVSASYTHIDQQTKRTALDKLPDVTGA